MKKKEHQYRDYIGITWLCYARSKSVALPFVGRYVYGITFHIFELQSASMKIGSQ